MPAQHPKTIKYWFLLGREPLLAAAEIGAVLSLTEYEYEPLLLKAGAADIDCGNLIGSLGGTIKIAVEVSDGADIEEIKKIIMGELKTIEGKIHFGISLYSQKSEKKLSLDFVKKLGLDIKKRLKEEGRSVRYVENKEPVLSSVTVEKNGLTKRGREFLMMPGAGGQFALAKTCAVQPFEQFSTRDYGRPGRDDLSGMLPPKLAMIMINLAQAPKNGTLLDPFCGSGTILTEAMLLGYKNLLGADISQKAVENTRKNIAWMEEQFAVQAAHSKMETFFCDVSDLDKKITANSVDAVVTEPYLGKPLKGNETKKQLLAQAEELKELYLQAFVQFNKILRPGGTVVIVIPALRYQNEIISVNCIEEIKKLGFEPQILFENKTSLTYSRPDQRVIREIWKFKKIN